MTNPKKPIQRISSPDTNHSTSPRLRYDRKGAARQLSISESTLDILTGNKELATTKQGKKVMYSYAELRRYVRKSHPDPIRGKQPKTPANESTPETPSKPKKAA
jgi:hypothetical protein